LPLHSLQQRVKFIKKVCPPLPSSPKIKENNNDTKIKETLTKECKKMVIIKEVKTKVNSVKTKTKGLEVDLPVTGTVKHRKSSFASSRAFLMKDSRNKKRHLPFGPRKLGSEIASSQSSAMSKVYLKGRRVPSIFSKDKRNLNQRMLNRGHCISYKGWKKKVDLGFKTKTKHGKSPFASLRAFSSVSFTSNFDLLKDLRSGDEAEEEDVENIEGIPGLVHSEGMKKKRKSKKRVKRTGVILIPSPNESEEVPDDWMDRLEDISSGNESEKGDTNKIGAWKYDVSVIPSTTVEVFDDWKDWFEDDDDDCNFDDENNNFEVPINLETLKLEPK